MTKNLIYEKPYYNVTGQNKIQIDSIGMVISWMFYFQRSDANLRNQWSNYTNWPYNYMPQDIIPASTDGSLNIIRTNPDGSIVYVAIGPGVNPNGHLTGWMITGNYNAENEKNILISFSILLDGVYLQKLYIL